jgi:hypothetical protein
MSLISNANNVAFASAYDIDKIVGVWEGSFNRAADVITRTGDLGDIYLYRIAHGFTRPVFVDLLWRITGDWTDGGSADVPGDTSIAFADSTYVYIVSSVFVAAVGTMEYKIIATWINEYDATNPSVDSFLSPNKEINFDSRENYQKVYLQDNLTFNADGTQTVTHALNRKANFRVFCEAIAGEVWPAYAGGASNPFLYDSSLTECEPYIDTSALSVELINVTAPKRAWYKIFLDS